MLLPLCVDIYTGRHRVLEEAVGLFLNPRVLAVNISHCQVLYIGNSSDSMSGLY